MNPNNNNNMASPFFYAGNVPQKDFEKMMMAGAMMNPTAFQFSQMPPQMQQQMWMQQFLAANANVNANTNAKAKTTKAKSSNCGFCEKSGHSRRDCKGKCTECGSTTDKCEKSSRKPCSNKKDAAKKGTTKATSSSSSSSSTTTCGKCKKQGHRADECDGKCHVCGKKSCERTSSTGCTDVTKCFCRKCDDFGHTAKTCPNGCALCGRKNCPRSSHTPCPNVKPKDKKIDKKTITGAIKKTSTDGMTLVVDRKQYEKMQKMLLDAEKKTKKTTTSRAKKQPPARVSKPKTMAVDATEYAAMQQQLAMMHSMMNAGTTLPVDTTPPFGMFN